VRAWHFLGPHDRVAMIIAKALIVLVFSAVAAVCFT
jgi:hypothetical protein